MIQSISETVKNKHQSTKHNIWIHLSPVKLKCWWMNAQWIFEWLHFSISNSADDYFVFYRRTAHSCLGIHCHTLSCICHIFISHICFCQRKSWDHLRLEQNPKRCVCWREWYSSLKPRHLSQMAPGTLGPGQGDIFQHHLRAVHWKLLTSPCMSKGPMESAYMTPCTCVSGDMWELGVEADCVSDSEVHTGMGHSGIFCS